MPKIKNLLSNWWNSAQTIHIPPTGGLDFSQEQINDEFTGPTNDSHGRRQRSGEQDISTVKCYNYNPYGHYSQNCPNQKLADGEAHVNSRTNDATTTSNSNNENYVPAGSGKAKNMMDAIDLDDYDPSYDGYDFFQHAAITRYFFTTTNKPRNTYLDVVQGQGTPPSNPGASGRGSELFNQSNCYIQVWYILLDNQYMVYVFSNAYLLTNILQAWHTLQISCNTWTNPITLVRDLEGYRKVWFHPEGTTNILYIS